MTMYQVRIKDRLTGQTLWVDAGYETAREAEEAAEKQLLLREAKNYTIEVEVK